jgi:hypothetical protein
MGQQLHTSECGQEDIKTNRFAIKIRMSPRRLPIPRLIAACNTSNQRSILATSVSQHNQPKPSSRSMPSKKTCFASSRLFPTQISSYLGRKRGSMASIARRPFGAKPMPALCFWLKQAPGHGKEREESWRRSLTLPPSIL